jgi:predicted GIY-YIG superfamily endonuclease
MHYVYILRSLKQEGAIYIGYTPDLKARLRSHNSSQNFYSRRHAPWEVETYVAFTNEQDAKAFERYLKGGSGKAFMQKHLVSKRFKQALKKFNNGRQSSKLKAE